MTLAVQRMLIQHKVPRGNAFRPVLLNAGTRD